MEPLLQALQPLFAPAFTLWGAPVTWLEMVAFVLALAMVGVQHPRQPAGLAAGDRQLAAVLRAVLEQPALRRREPADLLRRGRAAGAGGNGCAARRPTARALRVRTLGRRGAGSAARSALAVAWPATRPLPDALHRHRRALVGRLPDRRAAWSASGCSAASTSRTGRSGWSSTSSASALFAYKGLWLTVVLYAVFVAAVGGRLARLAAMPRAEAR